MKKLWILLCLAPFCALAQNDYSFFTSEDLEHIEASSKTEWGKPIVESLKQQVEKRRQHTLRVPLLEGGHLHHYFCPQHNVMFEFDWDAPHSHYCRLCKASWEGHKQFDWAWINLVHAENLKYLTASMYLYLVTKDTVYAGYIRDMLLDYASKYPTYMEHNTSRVVNGAWGGRMFGQSLDESVWTSDAARAYAVAKSVMTTTDIRTIEDGYLKVCADMLLHRKGSANWQVWHNSGLIALGVALRNDSIIDVALNDPLCGYHYLMDKHVYDDGWWSEGSPVYHYYPLRAMLLSADALRCRKINLFDKKLYSMFASPALGVYADLFFPSHNDGWYGESLTEQVKLYEIVYRRYDRDSLFLNVLEQSYQRTKRNSSEALQNNIHPESNPKTPALPSAIFKDLGVAILRSGAKTMVLKYGLHGGVHGHPDKLSIALHNGKKEILADMGTSAYGVPDYTQWYRKTLSHTTLTVDATDQQETTGKLLNFKPSLNGGLVEAEVTDAYPGVDMKRKLNLVGNQLTDLFTASSSSPHLYDYVLILTEKPIFVNAQEEASLDDAPVYKRLSNVKKIRARQTISCTLESGTTIRIQSLETAGFDVYTGEAPGIPPRNVAGENGYVAKPVYPLIIRIKGKELKIKTEWNIQ